MWEDGERRDGELLNAERHGKMTRERERGGGEGGRGRERERERE